MNMLFVPTHPITALVLVNEPILRAVARLKRDTPDGDVGATRIAAMVDRDKSNVSKSLKALEEDGLLRPFNGLARFKVPYLTDKGEAALAALDRAGQGDAAAMVAAQDAAPAGYKLLRHADIKPDPDNARTVTGLDEASIAELAESLREQGILQAPGVREPGDDDLHQLVYGERRWRAWGFLIERGDWSADRLILVKVESGDQGSLHRRALIENLQRADITNLEAGEGFVKLQDEEGDTPQKIAAEIGKDPRFVQIAMKVAREASAEDKAKYVESEKIFASGGKRNFTWTELRDTVGDKKVKPPLDLSPKLTLALVEIAHKALTAGEVVGLEDRFVRLSASPTGGAISTISERRLVVVKFDRGDVLYRLQYVSGRVDEHLAFLGFDKDPDAALQKVREEVLGALEATTLAREGRYATAELNPREAAPSLPSPASTPPVEGSGATFHANEIGFATRGEPPFAFAPEAEAQPADTPRATDHIKPLAAEVPVLTPSQRLIMVEILHKLFVEGAVPAGRPYKAVDAFEYWKDSAAGQLVTTHRMIGFGPGGTTGGQACFVTDRGRAWAAENDIDIDDGFSLEAAWEAALEDCEQEGRFAEPPYVTAWLNKPEPAAAPAAAPTAQSDFARQVAQANAEAAEEVDPANPVRDEAPAFDVDAYNAEQHARDRRSRLAEIVEYAQDIAFKLPYDAQASASDFLREIIEALSEGRMATALAYFIEAAACSGTELASQRLAEELANAGLTPPSEQPDE